MEIQQGFFLFQTSDNGKLKFHVEFKNFPRARETS